MEGNRAGTRGEGQARVQRRLSELLPFRRGWSGKGSSLGALTDQERGAKSWEKLRFGQQFNPEDGRSRSLCAPCGICSGTGFPAATCPLRGNQCGQGLHVLHPVPPNSSPFG